MNNDDKKGTFDNFQLLNFFNRHFKTIFITGMLAIILGVIVSFLLPEEYKATAIVFPTKNNILNIDNPLKNSDISAFGEEEEAEQLLQVLDSRRIKEDIIREFDLMSDFNINAEDPKSMDYALMNYDEHVKSTRTKYNSIRIDVFHQSKEKAANIANAIVDKADRTIKSMITQRERNPLESLIALKNIKQQKIDSINQSLTELTELGVVSLPVRSSLYEALAESVKYGERRLANEIEEQLKVNKKYSVKYDALRDELSIALDEFESLNNAANQLAANRELSLSHQFKLESAQVPQVKAKPVRWLVVATFLFTAIFLLLVYLVIKENLRLVRD